MAQAQKARKPGDGGPNGRSIFGGKKLTPPKKSNLNDEIAKATKKPKAPTTGGCGCW